MTMQLPLGWKGDPNADPNEILGHVMEEASTFTSGLSIAFDQNILNQRGSLSPVSDDAPRVGQRGPDVYLQKPATFESTRLHKETPNNARFYVVVFAGEPDKTRASISQLSEALQISTFFGDASLPVSWLTIPAKSGPSVFELLGVRSFGKTFYDQKHTAHIRYGVDINTGGIVVLRPDGWIGTTVTLGANAVQELEEYFKCFLTCRS